MSPEKVFGGDQVTFTAMITNAGVGDATGVRVRFLLDGVTLGSDRTIVTLPAGGSATVTAVWSAKHQTGPHTIEVRADPDNAIAEPDETNNRAVKTFTVQGGKVQ
jgi:uncharacterized repeat protein (TIGR01451 family)